MSLCYDSEKWLMITLVSIAITLTISLVSMAYGQDYPERDAALKALTDAEQILPKLEVLGPLLTGCGNAIQLGDLSIIEECARVMDGFRNHTEAFLNENKADMDIISEKIDLY
jgi:hypothetical protein